MLDVKGLFSVHSPNFLLCSKPPSRLDTSLRLGVLLSWEMKDVQIHEPAWPWHFSWLIFVARGPKSPANDFGREPNIGLILEYFLSCRISFPNSLTKCSMFNLFCRILIPLLLFNIRNTVSVQHLHESLPWWLSPTPQWDTFLPLPRRAGTTNLPWAKGLHHLHGFQDILKKLYTTAGLVRKKSFLVANRAKLIFLWYISNQKYGANIVVEFRNQPGELQFIFFIRCQNLTIRKLFLLLPLGEPGPWLRQIRSPHICFSPTKSIFSHFAMLQHVPMHANIHGFVSQYRTFLSCERQLPPSKHTAASTLDHSSPLGLDQIRPVAEIRQKTSWSFWDPESTGVHM